MRNRLTQLAETVKDPEQKKASTPAYPCVQNRILTHMIALRGGDGQLLRSLPPVSEWQGQGQRGVCFAVNLGN